MKEYPLKKYHTERKKPQPLPGPEQGTFLSHGMECSDVDEIYAWPTFHTDSIEVSDPDELFLSSKFHPLWMKDPTELTFTMEATDIDELYQNSVRYDVQSVNNCDFDDFLFL